MHEYLATEIHLLREAEQTGMLKHGHEPEIESLIERVAFLTAQIRKKIDDDFPEICESLLWQLWPQMLRPFPSATIIQFKPRIGQLQKTYQVPANTLLLSPPVGDNKQICKFRIYSPVNVNPLQINSVDVADAHRGGTLIKLNFQTEHDIPVNELDLSNLSLYLHANPALALVLHFALTGQVRKVEISFPDNPNHQTITIGEQKCIKPGHLSPNNEFNLLHEYFLFREKYLFISINGLEKITWPEDCGQFKLEIHTNFVLSNNYLISKENFLLHCVPAINLFAAASEPITLDHKRREYPLIADIENPDNMLIYSVDNVTGINQITGERFYYQPVYKNNDNGNYYSISRRGNAVYLSISDNDTAQKSLSCEITACNGHYPQCYLQENQITIPTTGFTNCLQFKNITRPTPLYLPPARDKYHRSLLAHLSLNYQSLNNIGTLKYFLSMHNWSKRDDNQKCIDSIHAIEITAINEVHKGALLHGLKFSLKIHESGFSSLADIHLFGLVIHHLFILHTNINYFTVTKICAHPSNQEFIWTTA